MKKRPYNFVLLLSFLLLGAVPVYLSASFVTKYKASGIPDEVNRVFERSCNSCHTSPGNSMALSRVNFSKWDQYTVKQQFKKALAVCKTITKKTMPPKFFVESNAGATLSQEETALICKWAASLPPK
jgi:cytochrome c5